MSLTPRPREGSLETYGAHPVQTPTPRSNSSSKEFRDLKIQYDILEKEFNKNVSRLDNLKTELAKSQKNMLKQENELSIVKGTVQLLNSEKQKLNKELNESKEYIRKLEQKFISGTKGQFLSDINLQLRTQLEEVLSKNNEKDTVILKLRQANKDLENQLSVLQRALSYTSAKEEDSSTNLASFIQKSEEEMKQILIEKENELERALIHIEELKLVREANNVELVRVETENFKQEQEIKALTEQNKTLAKDRSSLLQCIEDMSAQLKEYELDLEYFNKELSIQKETQKASEDELEIIKHERREFLNEIDRYKVQNQSLISELEKVSGLPNKAQSKDTEIELLALKDQLKEYKNKWIEEEKLRKEKENELNILIQKYRQTESALEELKEKKKENENNLRLQLDNTVKEFEELLEEKEGLKEAMNKVIDKSEELNKYRSESVETMPRSKSVLSQVRERKSAIKESSDGGNIWELIAQEKKKNEELIKQLADK
ncbi:IWS1_1 [Blepharisma stoltei]|uniref:Uncharacterized protein n=1 Tax=Blepharisma stoltei TaxID=1481888 RepID=A0AAU9J5P1_9CILI|nr:unnamed protein product [Blepharisma stoltei]